MTSKRRAQAARALFVATLAGLAFAFPGDATARVIQAGKERAVLDLLRPYVDEGDVGKDAMIAGVSIARDRITVHLRHKFTPQWTSQVVLLPRSDANEKTGAFIVRVATQQTATLAQRQVRAAAELVAATIRKNDDGKFFAVDIAAAASSTTSAKAAPGFSVDREPDARDRVKRDDERSTFSLWDADSARLARLGWAALAALLLWAIASFSWQVFAGPGRVRLLVLAVLTLCVFGSSLAQRRALPMWPLHANNHAYEDIEAALGEDASGPAVQRHIAGYGASWLVGQRLALSATGPHHEGLADTSAWFSSLAVTFGFVAAILLGGHVVLAFALAIAMAWLPVAMHIGHSESTLAVAQFLVACCLLFSSAVSMRWGVAGLLVSLALLSSGHVVAPVYAVGMALLCWALSTAALAGAQRGPLHFALKRLSRGPKSGSALWFLLLFALPATQLVMRATMSAEVGARLEATGSALPIPGNPLYFSLWMMEIAPAALTLLAAAGVIAIFAAEDERPTWLRRATTVSAALGLCIVFAASLLVCACLGDALRYQSVLAAPFLACGALSLRAATYQGTVARWSARGLVVLLALIAVRGAASQDGIAGIEAPGNADGFDAQSRAYRAFRKAVTDRRNDVWIVDPGRTSSRGAVLSPVVGKLSARGPIMRRLDVSSLRSMCDAALTLPGPVVLWWDPACAIDAREDGTASACRALHRFIAPQGSHRAGHVATGRDELVPKGLRGEFLAYGERRLRWQLAVGRCPDDTASGRSSPQRPKGLSNTSSRTTPLTPSNAPSANDSHPP